MSGLNADFTSDAYLNGVLLAEARKKSLTEALLLVDPKTPPSAVAFWVTKAKEAGLGVDMKEYFHPVRRQPVVDIVLTASKPCFDNLIELSERRLPENPSPVFLAGVLHALCTVRKTGDLVQFGKPHLSGPALDAFEIPHRRGKSEHNLYVDMAHASDCEVLEAPIAWYQKAKDEVEEAILHEAEPATHTIDIEDVPNREAQQDQLIASAAGELATFRAWRSRMSDPAPGIQLTQDDNEILVLLPGAPAGKTQRRAVEYLLGKIDEATATPFPELADVLPAPVVETLHELEESLQGRGLAQDDRVGKGQVLLCRIDKLERGQIAAIRMALDAIGLQERLYREYQIVADHATWSKAVRSFKAYLGGRTLLTARYVALWMALLAPQAFFAPLPAPAARPAKVQWFELPGLSQVDHSQLLPALLNPFTGEAIPRTSPSRAEPIAKPAVASTRPKPTKELYNPFASEVQAAPVSIIEKGREPESTEFVGVATRKASPARRKPAKAKSRTRLPKRTPSKSPKRRALKPIPKKPAAPAKQIRKRAAPPKPAPSKAKNVYAKNQISRNRSPF